MNTQTETHLPYEAKRLLSTLQSRKVTLSVMPKKDENGRWHHEIQATGAIFGNDWQKLRQYHEPFVKYLTQQGLVDEGFQEVVLLPRTERIGGDHVLFTTEERRARAENSDKRAAESKRVVSEHERQNKLEWQRLDRLKKRGGLSKRERVDLWNESQDQILIAKYHSADWPDIQARPQREARRKIIMEAVGAVGPARTWESIHSRISRLREQGLVERKTKPRQR